MRDLSQVIIFAVDGQRFAVRLAQVERVVSAVEVTPLPGAPAVVRGMFDLHGEVLPVYDARLRFHARAQPVRASDQLIVLKSATGKVALLVQETVGIFDIAAFQQASDTVGDRADAWFEGTMRLADDLILVHDIDKFLSAAETGSLEQAMDAAA